jgi:hypothetical protein
MGEHTWNSRDNFSNLISALFLHRVVDRLTCNRYNIVVFPAESNPTINILTSLSFPHTASDETD